jgi:hypothetical protein
MATGDELKKKDDSSAEEENSTSSYKKPEIEALGVEVGVEALPYNTPYAPMSVTGSRQGDKELREVLHDQSEEWGPSVRDLVTMRRMDGQARALYRLLTLPIKAALNTATFVPEEGGDAEAEFIDMVFNTAPANGGMSVTFHRFMSQMLQGLFDGFAAFEKVFWVPETGPLQGKTTLKKLAHRPAETVTFVVDEKGGFAGLRQRSWNGTKPVDVYIEPEYAFYYAAQEEERKFYGVSFFQAAYNHYDIKAKTYVMAHLAAQRGAVGTRVGTVPPNASASAKREFVAMLKQLAFAQYMVMPEGFEVEIQSETSKFDYLAAINHHNSQMSKSLLAGFFDKEQGAGDSEGGLIERKQPGDDMFMLMLRAIMDDVANQINHYIIPQLIDLNFDGAKYPKFVWGKLTDEQKSAIARTFDTLSTAGQSMTVTPEFMRQLEEHQAEEMGLDIDYDEVDKRIEEEAAEAEKQLQAQNAAAGIGPDGQPLPPAPVDPEAEIDEFHNSVSLSHTVDEQTDGYADLMRMANELLDKAQDKD